METLEAPYISITDAIASHAKWHPDKNALVCGEQRRTWREFNGAINRVANGLRASGLRKGDKVSALMPNGVEMLEVMLGTVKAGGVIVPLSTMLTAPSLMALVNDSDSGFLFVGERFIPLVSAIKNELSAISADRFFVLGEKIAGWTAYPRWRDGFAEDEPGVQIRPDDDFNLIYSSGTTGTPKGIAHTHYARQQMAYVLAVEFRFDTNSVVVVSTPLYSNGTWMMLLPALTLGAQLVIMPEFSPHGFLELVERERGTHTFMVPTQYVAIMQAPGLGDYDLSTMKTLLSAGAPLRAETKKEMLRKLGAGVFELYGLTEGIATTLKPEEMMGKITSVGKPIPGSDIRIIDEAGRELPRGETGEIVGYGAAMMRGYYKKPEATSAAIWKDERGRTYLRTGDVGRLDGEGFLYLLDRRKDMILSGGINVYPSDIEEVIAGHEAVAEAAVIGIPHEKWGETPLAFVVRKNGDTTSAEELTNWANARLAKYQRISRVEFRDELPRNALGKVLKKELRDSYQGKAE